MIEKGIHRSAFCMCPFDPLGEICHRCDIKVVLITDPRILIFQGNFRELFLFQGILRGTLHFLQPRRITRLVVYSENQTIL